MRAVGAIAGIVTSALGNVANAASTVAVIGEIAGQDRSGGGPRADGGQRARDAGADRGGRAGGAARADVARDLDSSGGRAVKIGDVLLVLVLIALVIAWWEILAPSMFAPG